MDALWWNWKVLRMVLDPVQPIQAGEAISPKAGMFTRMMGDEKCIMGPFEPGAGRN
jgi:hypothetical protein